MRRRRAWGTARVFLWHEGTWDKYKLTKWVHNMHVHVRGSLFCHACAAMLRVTIPPLRALPLYVSRANAPRRTGAYKISEEATAAAVKVATTHGLRVDTSTSTLPEIYADTDGRVVDQKRRRVQSHALLHDGVNHFADGVFFGKFLDNFDEGSYAPVLGVMYHLNDGARRAGTRASLSLRNEASEPQPISPRPKPWRAASTRPIRDDEPPSCGGFNDRNPWC